jgi:hypothetical protein
MFSETKLRRSKVTQYQNLANLTPNPSPVNVLIGGSATISLSQVEPPLKAFGTTNSMRLRLTLLTGKLRE